MGNSSVMCKCTVRCRGVGRRRVEEPRKVAISVMFTCSNHNNKTVNRMRRRDVTFINKLLLMEKCRYKCSFIYVRICIIIMKTVESQTGGIICIVQNNKLSPAKSSGLN